MIQRPEVAMVFRGRQKAEGHSNFLGEVDTTDRQLGVQEIMKSDFSLDCTSLYDNINISKLLHLTSS